MGMQNYLSIRCPRGLLFAMLGAMCSVLYASEGAPGEGLTITFRDKYVYVQGSILRGDGAKFVQRMQNADVQCPLVRLNSGGGSGVDAVEIGTYIRRHRLATWTDGLEDKCASACNRIFAGGIIRIYSNAQWIPTGKHKKLREGMLHGLGYHHPRHNGDFQAAAPHYRANIVPYLKAMLPPEAFDWVYDTDTHNLTPDMVWLNGDKALELGIATTDQVPSECLP